MDRMSPRSAVMIAVLGGQFFQLDSVTEPKKIEEPAQLKMISHPRRYG